MEAKDKIVVEVLLAEREKAKEQLSHIDSTINLYSKPKTSIKVNTKLDELREWFKDHPCLSITCLEKKAGIPSRTLHHFIQGNRELNSDHTKKLAPILFHYGCYINFF